MCAERRDNLQEEETEGEANAFPDTWDHGIISRGAVFNIRLRGKLDNGFDNKRRRDLCCISNDFKDAT